MECTVDVTQKIWIRKHYVVCHSTCGRIVKVQLRRKANIKPEVAVKYYRYLARKIGQQYLIEKRPCLLSKESQLLLERIVGQELSRAGIAMDNLAAGAHAKVSLSPPHSACSCPRCTPALCHGAVPLYVELRAAAPLAEPELLNLTHLVIAREKILDKIKYQETLYNKYGIDAVRMLRRRFFGCYRSRGKMLGIKPFTLKGQWTKEKARDFFYSFKTALALQDLSLFITLRPAAPASDPSPAGGHPNDPNRPLVCQGAAVDYAVKIHKIDLKSQRTVEKRVAEKNLSRGQWRLWM